MSIFYSSIFSGLILEFSCLFLIFVSFSYFYFFSVNVNFFSDNDIFMVLGYVLLLFNDNPGAALHTSEERCDSYHRKSNLWH